jgi:hypothetical protein
MPAPALLAQDFQVPHCAITENHPAAAMRPICPIRPIYIAQQI